MVRFLLYHCGLDAAGNRHQRFKTAAEVRRCRQQHTLMPRTAVPPHRRDVWRNGLHQRHWLLVASQVRADRRCFLMTLPRPPLNPPIPAFAAVTRVLRRF